MRTEKQVRFEAASAAHEAMLEKAAKQPEKVMAGMQEYPHLVSEFSLAALQDIIDVLLQKGHRGELLALCDDPAIVGWARRTIVEMALFS